MGKEHDKKVKALMGLGYSKDQANNALLIYEGDQNLAAEYLL